MNLDVLNICNEIYQIQKLLFHVARRLVVVFRDQLLDYEYRQQDYDRLKDELSALRARVRLLSKESQDLECDQSQLDRLHTKINQFLKAFVALNLPFHKLQILEALGMSMNQFLVNFCNHALISFTRLLDLQIKSLQQINFLYQKVKLYYDFEIERVFVQALEGRTPNKLKQLAYQKIELVEKSLNMLKTQVLKQLKIPQPVVPNVRRLSSIKHRLSRKFSISLQQVEQPEKKNVKFQSQVSKKSIEQVPLHCRTAGLLEQPKPKSKISERKRVSSQKIIKTKRKAKRTMFQKQSDVSISLKNINFTTMPNFSSTKFRTKLKINSKPRQQRTQYSIKQKNITFVDRRQFSIHKSRDRILLTVCLGNFGMSFGPSPDSVRRYLDDDTC